MDVHTGPHNEVVDAAKRHDIVTRLLDVSQTRDATTGNRGPLTASAWVKRLTLTMTGLGAGIRYE